MHLAYLGLPMKRVNNEKCWNATETPTCTHRHTHAHCHYDDKRTHAFRFSFCFTFSSISLTRIKWSARAVASVNRDLDLVKESIRCCSNVHACAFKHSFLRIRFIETNFTVRGTVAVCYCCGCRLSSSLIFNTHTLFFFIPK